MHFLNYRNTCRTKSSADDLRLSDNESKINNTTADRAKHHSTRSVSDYDGDSARDDSGDSVCDNSDDPRTFDSLEANEAYSRVVHSVKLPARRESVDSEDSERESSWLRSAEYSGNELEGEETGETTKEDVPKKPPRMYIMFVLFNLARPLGITAIWVRSFAWIRHVILGVKNWLSTFFVCLLDETLKAVGPFYLVSMPGEVKQLIQGVNV